MTNKIHYKYNQNLNLTANILFVISHKNGIKMALQSNVVIAIDILRF